MQITLPFTQKPQAMKKFTLLFVLVAFVFAAQAQRTVAFRIDMSQETVSALGVSIAGSFQSLAGGADWSPGVIMLEDPDGNGVYTHFASFTSSDAASIEFKFLNGNAWGTDESVTETECGGAGGFGNNRFAEIPAGSDLFELPVYYFGTCTLSPLQPSNAQDALRRAVNLTPNPADNQTVLSFDIAGTYEVAVSNMAGQTIRTYSGVTNSLSIDRDGLGSGIYFVNITDADGNRVALKLVLR